MKGGCSRGQRRDGLVRRNDLRYPRRKKPDALAKEGEETCRQSYHPGGDDQQVLDLALLDGAGVRSMVVQMRVEQPVDAGNGEQSSQEQEVGQTLMHDDSLAAPTLHAAG